MSTYHFIMLWVRIVSSFLTAIYMTLHGRWHEYEKGLISPLFYLAFVLSFLLAFGAMYIIHLFNDFLEQKFPIRHRPIIRILLQVIICICLPLAIIISVMYAFYETTGRTFSRTDYMSDDWPIVVLLIVILNGILLVADLVFSRQHKPDTIRSETLVVSFDRKQVLFNLPDDILYFYKHGKVVKMRTASGHEYTTRESISILAKKYGHLGYCQVSPAAIINIGVLKGFAPGNQRDTLYVLFKVQYHEVVRNHDPNKLRVTKKFLDNFKIALAREQHHAAQ